MEGFADSFVAGVGSRAKDFVAVEAGTIEAQGALAWLIIRSQE